ncbi:8460_t:CDS:2 [Funneliformis geosporum]|nr:8460_t:CDS:2 [Funneliformis geosporum]
MWYPLEMMSVNHSNVQELQWIEELSNYQRAFLMNNNKPYTDDEALTITFEIQIS